MMLQSSKYKQLEIESIANENDIIGPELDVDDNKEHFHSHNSAKQCLHFMQRNARLVVIIAMTAVIILIIVVISTLYSTKAFSTDDRHPHSDHHGADCIDSCCIFCGGEILDVVQHFDFFNDSKV